MKIWFVEDNPDFQEEIAFQLEYIGHEVQCFSRGFDLLEKLGGAVTPDAILLDLGLPDVDGIKLTRKVRARYPDIVLVMLTARVAPNQKAEGWRVGADAYLTKPVHLDELRSVIESLVIRRISGKNERNPFWQLDVGASRLTSPSGLSVELSHSELAILKTLACSANEILSRQSLIVALGRNEWDYDARNLEAVISRLRKKMRQLQSERVHIRPVRGIGYKLLVDMRMS